MQHFPRLLQSRSNRNRDEAVLGHPLRDREIESRLESQVTIGENADEFAVLVGHWHSGNLVLLHYLQRLGDLLPGAHRHRIDNHACFRPLDPVDLLSLLVDRHVLVNHTEATLLRDRDGEPCRRDRVHRGGDDWYVERDVAGQTCGGIDEVGVDVGMAGDEKDVVERQGERHASSEALDTDCKAIPFATIEYSHIVTNALSHRLPP